MPLARFEKLQPSKRARLIEVATAEFAARGFSDASLNEILAASGLGKSSYYYYFVDKEDLFATVVNELYRSLTSVVPPPKIDAKSANAFWQAIEEWHLGWLKAIVQRPHAMRIVRAAQTLRRSRSVNESVAFAQLSEMVRDVIREGQARGFVRKDLAADVLVDLVEAADGALDAALFAEHDDPSPARLRAHTRLALDTTRRLLSPA